MFFNYSLVLAIFEQLHLLLEAGNRIIQLYKITYIFSKFLKECRVKNSLTLRPQKTYDVRFSTAV